MKKKGEAFIVLFPTDRFSDKIRLAFVCQLDQGKT